MKPDGFIEAYLNAQGVPYLLMRHAPTTTLAEAARVSSLRLSDFVRAVVLEDARGRVMVVMPATHMLDFNALNQQLGRDLRLLPARETHALFPDCEPTSIPPVGEHYHLPTLLDEAVAGMGTVYFEPGSHKHLVRMKGSDFLQLHRHARRGTFARPAAALASPDSHEFTAPGRLTGSGRLTGLHSAQDILQRIGQVQHLPPLPETTRQLLELRQNPRASVLELEAIVAQDPSMAAQMLRYANSAFYGYRGKIDSLHDAIVRILGFEVVLNMAMALSAGKKLRLPAEGPLGRQAFWHHAVHTAALAQALNTLLPSHMRGKPGMVYLTALLHDFGFLLLAHLFPAEHFLLNRTVAANPQIPVPLIEKRLLGVDHTQLGQRLMEAWDMPAELRATITHHHDEHYRGEHAIYPNLVLLAEHLLKESAYSDAADSIPPAIILTSLGLQREQVQIFAQNVLEDLRPGLETVAAQLAA